MTAERGPSNADRPPAEETPEGILLDEPTTADLRDKVTDAWREFAGALAKLLVTLPADAHVDLTLDPTASGTGDIVITARAIAGGIDVTPNPPPTVTIRINASAPVLTGVTATRGSGTITVTVSGFVPNKQVTQASFTFNAAPGSSFQTTTVTVPVESIFNGWFQSTAAGNFGGSFTYRSRQRIRTSSDCPARHINDRAFLRERKRYPLADTSAGTGDDCNLSRE